MGRTAKRERRIMPRMTATRTPPAHINDTPYVDPQAEVRAARTMGPGFGPGAAREMMDANTFTGRPSVAGRRHMISAVHYLATMGGLRVLERGGNAIDAGVAAGICINVV